MEQQARGSIQIQKSKDRSLTRLTLLDIETQRLTPEIRHCGNQKTMLQTIKNVTMRGLTLHTLNVFSEVSLRNLEPEFWSEDRKTIFLRSAVQAYSVGPIETLVDPEIAQIGKEASNYVD